MKTNKIFVLVLVLILSIGCNTILVTAESVFELSDTKKAFYILNGASEYNNLFALVQKDDKKDVYFIDKNEDNSFRQIIYFTFGQGEYTISLYTRLNKDTLGCLYTYKITSSSTANTYLMPSGFAPQTKDIKKLARSVKGDTTTRSKELLDWVFKNIEYDYKLLESDDGIYDYPRTAVTALQNKKGVCYEKAALYVSLLRCSGIPAKLIIGKCTVKNETFGHAWVEFYNKDSNQWIKAETTGGFFIDDEDYKSYVKDYEK